MTEQEEKVLREMVSSHVACNIYATGLMDLLTEDGKYELYEPVVTKPDSPDEEPYEQEPLEFWAVDSDMAEMLQREGEAVRHGIWCRTTSGQAIWQDDVFETIARKWRILK